MARARAQSQRRTRRSCSQDLDRGGRAKSTRSLDIRRRRDALGVRRGCRAPASADAHRARRWSRASDRGGPGDRGRARTPAPRGDERRVVRAAASGYAAAGQREIGGGAARVAPPTPERTRRGRRSGRGGEHRGAPRRRRPTTSLAGVVVLGRRETGTAGRQPADQGRWTRSSAARGSSISRTSWWPLLRARDVPARVAAVYAPGLSRDGLPRRSPRRSSTAPGASSMRRSSHAGGRSSGSQPGATRRTRRS